MNQSYDDIAMILKSINLDVLQFHGKEDKEFCSQFNKPFFKTIGVNDLINSKNHPDSLNIYKEDKGNFDITFECSGTQSGLKDGIESTKPYGTLIQVGLGGDPTFPLVPFTAKELTLKGSFRFHLEFPLAIDLMQKKIIDVKPFITHSFKMDEAEKAFKVALNPDLKSMKTQINFN